MLFSSWKFLCLFLPLTLAVFFLLPVRVGMGRKGGLLLASFVFYGAWKISALPLLCGSIIFNFWVCDFLVRWKDQPRARLLIIFGVLCNLGVLGYYKYAGFTVGILQAITQRSFVMPQIILPLAISFFTFTQIAYIIDVYRDHTRHYRFWDYVLFVVMFPHLIAGPIVRHWEIIPQYAGKEMRPSLADLHAGTILFLMGLFKKVLIADPLAVNANAIYDAAATGVTPTFFDGWFGTLCYALQLYFDFSGYSDMAIGLARMFGIRFPCNFNSPYRSLSISEFWSRWHITLTRFLREYVYFPLGGNRAGEGAGAEGGSGPGTKRHAAGSAGATDWRAAACAPAARVPPTSRAATRPRLRLPLGAPEPEPEAAALSAGTEVDTPRLASVRARERRMVAGLGGDLAVNSGTSALPVHKSPGQGSLKSILAV
jgi:D-alanyl-lipoteichoic acid acyltransferase DltB (MBOAT superfamily)